MPRKKGPPAALRIDTPTQNPSVALALGDSSASNSAISPATSDSESSFFPPPNLPRSTRNMKRLSLALPSARSSSSSLAIPHPDSQTGDLPDAAVPGRPRRLSVVSLPVTTAPALLRGEEEGSPSAPYLDGPIEILPKIWLGSEDNARNWPGLIERGIRSILNVAKEVSTPFDTTTSQSLRSFASTPNLTKTLREQHDTYYPAHKLSGRPGMHYLKLQWSHGQSDLVQYGFTAAMSFVDQALERGDGVLIHCQCGISRSATLVIGLVMRAAASRSPNVPPAIWELKGMQGAYAYVKEKSQWVGPNMSLIYQLLEYERALRGDASSGSSEQYSVIEAEEEWGRRRQMLDEASDPEEEGRESSEIMREARALDKAMEDRLVARKSSNSSMGSGIGMGAAWKSRYGARKRAGSIASNMTSNSILSEDLVEEDEEQELLGTGGGFDRTSIATTSSTRIDVERVDDTGSMPTTDSENDNRQATPIAPRNRRPPRLPPSAPASKSSFTLPPIPATAFKSSFTLPPVPPSATKSTFSLPPVPPSATKSSFDIPPRPSSHKPKRRPPPLGLLPPVPHSPVAIIDVPSSVRPTPTATPRVRTESRKPSTPPLHLRKPKNLTLSAQTNTRQIPLATPSQTLFVFPPSPTLTARTPSAMTLTSNHVSVPFPSSSTPRVSKFQKHGRTRSLMGFLAPPTPTTAHSRVDARGWFGDK
ncbi:hypothetical protein EW146_g91 [Bondarzewia mesenterica]|uniref:protein-tyrosine-phosphatase n=1 Tax=Bondarzewia mesenterica TaxID=1095465 RepID=A0A4S4M821_9AGAM|nr:hypothetical protein EW146_g91 [Bondarzewia mesenterica]